MKHFVWVVFVMACTSSKSQVCGDAVCPATAMCIAELSLCSTSDAILQCVDMPAAAPCTLNGQEANCQPSGDFMVCQPMVCGNGLSDRGETCDDGNNLPLDGCSSDCLSREVCGNGIVDLTAREQCDDGNFLEHDGCSSTCRDESPRWTIGTPPARKYGTSAFDAKRGEIITFGGISRVAAEFASVTEMWAWNAGWTEHTVFGPPFREKAAMAYDSEHERVILYGGGPDDGEGSDVWSWDGSAWTRLPDAPVHTNAASMAYDPVRKKLVVFGGLVDQTETDTTLEFDGTTWTTVTTATKPFARFLAHMAWDPDRNKIILFGGNGANSGPFALNDTWDYDGAWHELIPLNGGVTPPVMQQGSMAYDKTSHRMILVGGTNVDGNVFFGDTYALAFTPSATWTKLAPTVTPRAGAMLGEDATGGLVLFGGGNSSAEPVDTQRWNGSAWIAQSSGARISAGGAYDFDRRTLVIFGGQISSTVVADTLELSASGWRQVPPQTTAVTFPSLAYDTDRHETIRFGGMTAMGAFVNTTFGWTGTTWGAKTVASPPPARSRAMLVHSNALHETVLFGGQGTGSALPLADTWRWNGTTWTQDMSTPSPPGRTNTAAAYDPVRQQIVMFGGGIAPGLRNDTWIYDGAWHELAPVNSPTPRGNAALAWNPARQRLVLTGSAEFTFETWEWDGTDWTQIVIEPQPRSTQDHIAYPLADGSGIGIVTGQGHTGVLRTDTWQFAYASDSVGDSCALEIDRDGDGLASCDDPDCWPVCTPGCLPGVTDCP